MSSATDLLTTWQHLIDDLTIITGDRGIFDVHVDGELIYSKHETGRHVEPGEVLRLFTELVGPDARPYGT